MDYLLQNLHFIFIHVPIAMLIFGFLFDLAAVVLKKRTWHTAGLLCLAVGTLGAIASVLTGPDDRNPLLHTHEQFGEFTMILAILLSVARLFFLFRRKKEIGGSPVYLIGALIAVALVSYTGHLGGQMVHKAKPANGIMQQGPGNPGGGQKPGGGPNRGGAAPSPSVSAAPSATPSASAPAASSATPSASPSAK